jgi:hypothetical protein
MSEVLLGIDDSKWVAILDEAPHDFYHLPGYVDLCAREDRGEARALVVEDSGATLLLPLILRSLPEGDRLDASSPYGYPGPIWAGNDDQAVRRSLLAAGLEALRDTGLVSLFVRLHPLLNPDPPHDIGAVVRHGDTISIDLSTSTEALWAETRANHRRQINRALRDGYSARMDETLGQLDTFVDLYRQTMTRRQAARGYFFDNAYFAALPAALGPRLHLAVVEKDGAIAAAGLFVETNGIVQYHLSGTDGAHTDSQPLKLMIHFVRSWARERGAATLHLGGGLGSVNDSLFQFKLGFSPRRHPFHTLRAVLDEPAYRRLVRDRDPSLDPSDVTGYFPLYRSAPSQPIAAASAAIDGVD